MAARSRISQSSEWPLQLLRVYLASGYFSSGMCKLLCGARFGRFWGKGTTLQMYIFDSMWSRPAWAPVRKPMRRAARPPGSCRRAHSGR